MQTSIPFHIKSGDHSGEPGARQDGTCMKLAPRFGDGGSAIVGNVTQHASVMVSDGDTGRRKALA